MRAGRCAQVMAALALVACGDDATPPLGERPTAVLVAPNRADPDTLVRLDARLSSDPDDAIVGFSFDFGDGSPRQISADGFATHTYAGDGTFTITLAVLDEAGNKGTAEHTIVVGTGINDGSGQGEGSGTGEGSGINDGSGTSSGSGQGSDAGQNTP